MLVLQIAYLTSAGSANVFLYPVAHHHIFGNSGLAVEFFHIFFLYTDRSTREIYAHDPGLSFFWTCVLDTYIFSFFPNTKVFSPRSSPCLPSHRLQSMLPVQCAFVTLNTSLPPLP